LQVSDRWRAEVESLEASHAREMKELRAKYEKRLGGYKAAVDQANEGWQASLIKVVWYNITFVVRSDV
jgi:hypothetical protein